MEHFSNGVEWWTSWGSFGRFFRPKNPESSAEKSVDPRSVGVSAGLIFPLSVLPKFSLAAPQVVGGLWGGALRLRQKQEALFIAGAPAAVTSRANGDRRASQVARREVGQRW